jgi:transcriptional regulator with XRE-family HTH domain
MTKTIGNRIKNLRQGLKINQMQLAELLNVDQSHISHFENGRYEPNLKQLMKLKYVLNTEYDYLIEGKEHEKTPEKPENLGTKWENLHL